MPRERYRHSRISPPPSDIASLTTRSDRPSFSRTDDGEAPMPTPPSERGKSRPAAFMRSASQAPSAKSRAPAMTSGRRRLVQPIGTVARLPFDDPDVTVVGVAPPLSVGARKQPPARPTTHRSHRPIDGVVPVLRPVL